MANIVTQLQNKDGDNLYPLAGGMAADSITTAMIQDGAVTAAKASFTTYSTSEQVVGTWTDGKPIYRSVIDITATIAAGTRETISFLQNKIKYIISAKGYISDGTVKTVIGQPWIANAATGYVLESGVLVDGNDTGYMHIRSAANASLTGKLVVEYTKPTD